MGQFTSKNAMSILDRIVRDLEGFSFGQGSSSLVGRNTSMGRQIVTFEQDLSGVISIVLGAENPNRMTLSQVLIDFVKEFSKNLDGGHQLGLTMAGGDSSEVVFMYGIWFSDDKVFRGQDIEWVDSQLWELSMAIEPIFDMIRERGI